MRDVGQSKMRELYFIAGLLPIILAPIVLILAIVFLFRSPKPEVESRESYGLPAYVLLTGLAGLFFSQALNPMKCFSPSIEGMVTLPLYILSLGVSFIASWWLIRTRSRFAVVLGLLNLLLLAGTYCRAMLDTFS